MIEIPENTFVDLYAQDRPTGFRNFYPHPKQVEMCGKEWPIVAVRVTVDPEGDFHAWDEVFLYGPERAGRRLIQKTRRTERKIMSTDKKMRALLSPKVEQALGKAVDALRGAGIEFALVGGLALDAYADEPRFTRDIDFVVSAENWKKAVRAVQAAGFRYGEVDHMLTQLENKDGVRVDLLFGVGDPEESAHATAKIKTVLGVKTPIAAPEFLVWMYLLSDQRRHEEDAETLVKKGIDLPKLALWLRQTRSTHELARLARIVARVRGG